jgi:RHS repeat-associated protein
MDDLSRLLKAEEGKLSSGSISGRTRQQLWSLDQLGNQLTNQVDANGDNDFVDTGEMNDTQTFSAANATVTRSAMPNNPTYDAVGNETDDGQYYKHYFDAFGRLIYLSNRSNNDPLSVYRYNGLGYRIKWQWDSNGAQGVNCDQDYAGGAVIDHCDNVVWFAYDVRWRQVASFINSDSNPKEAFVYHNAGGAGLAGKGGSSYIDAVVLRDRDNTTSFPETADATLEERRYILQNWRADVSVVLTPAGAQVEAVKYSAYGVPIAIPAGDINNNGAYDASDGLTGAYSIVKDVNLDGVVDAGDTTAANAVTGGYHTLGRGINSDSAVGLRKAYAGYEIEPAMLSGRPLYHVRHRVLDASVGKWTRRDPIGYRDSMELYAYVATQPIISTDPYGLAICICGGICQVPDHQNIWRPKCEGEDPDFDGFGQVPDSGGKIDIKPCTPIGPPAMVCTTTSFDETTVAEVAAWGPCYADIRVSGCIGSCGVKVCTKTHATTTCIFTYPCQEGGSVATTTSTEKTTESCGFASGTVGYAPLSDGTIACGCIVSLPGGSAAVPLQKFCSNTPTGNGLPKY